MIKKVITHPQQSDMGSGFGEWQFDETPTLNEFLTYFKDTNNSWGTFAIRYSDGRILRLFDYNIYNKKQFYIDLNGWQYDFKIKSAKFEYCFMNENIVVNLEK